MASTSRWQCLLRPARLPISPELRNPTFHNPARTFTSTSASSFPAPKQAAKGEVQSRKGVKTLKIKKRAPPQKTGKPPAPGERKAMRKRIVLSNTNALEVPWLEDFTTANLTKESTITKVKGIPESVVDQLRAVDAFKTKQAWSLFRRPGMLIRKETVELAQMLERVHQDRLTERLVIDGARGTGKSMVLLQAIAAAYARGWIVLNIPEAQELTTAVTAYAPIPDTKPVLYSQNTYVANLLGQIAKANGTLLSKMEVTKKHELPIPLQSNISLSRLAELGARDPEIAWPVFQAFWFEITAPGRPQILMSLDGLSHIMKFSDYRTPDFELIHAHDLSLVKHFVDHLSGKASLPNGGAIVAATSKGNSPITYAVDIAMQRQAERQAGVAEEEISRPDPWKKLDQRSYEVLQKAKVMQLKGLSKEEARGLMEYWAASGLLRQRVDEKNVTERWALGGSGVVGEIERNALWMRI